MPSVSRAARYLTVLGPVLVVVALSKVHAAYVADPPYDYTASFRLAWSIFYAAVLAVAVYGVGLPELPRSARQAALAAVGAAAAAAVAISIMQLVTGDGLLPRFVVFGSALVVVPYELVIWGVARQGQAAGEQRDRVFLVAPEREVDQLAADLNLAPERPSVLAGSLSVAATHPTGERDKPLVEAAIREGATVVVLGRGALVDEAVVAQAALLHEAGVRVRSLLQFYEQWLGKLPASELERATLFFDIGEVHKVRYGRIKRLVDVGGAVVGLIPLALVVPLVAVGNLFGNRGPLWYRQERVGRGGEAFTILKFRTMRPTESPMVTSDWTAAHDPRVTAFGRLLRATHLDELPQVINILRGDLSWVGPRPEQPRYVTELSRSLPFYGLRHVVRPGLTGWAQVKYGYAGDERDALEKLQYEFFYLSHQGIRFDLRVMARTVRSIAGSEGKGR